MKDPGKLLRLFRSLNLLAGSKRGYTVQELADKLEVSYRTVYRDLRIFEETGFELIQHPLSRRFRMSNALEISDKMHFNQSEAEVLEQALVALPDGPVKQLLFDKVHALSGSTLQLKGLQKQQIARNFQQLAKAMRDKLQVMLIDYNSPSSQSMRDRLVEPFAFGEKLDMVYCFEPASRKNKIFKLERIGQVRLEQHGWQFDFLHEQRGTDIFGMPLEHGASEVQLTMGRLSASLLREEHPAAIPYLESLADGHFRLRLAVADFRGIGRFVLGLLDDIRVEGSPEFKSYLQGIVASAAWS